MKEALGLRPPLQQQHEVAVVLYLLQQVQVVDFQRGHLVHVKLRAGKSGKFVVSGTRIADTLRERCDCKATF